MSDRILVMRQGRIMGELARDEATEERVMQLAVGNAAAGGPLRSAPQVTRASMQP
jgi:ABC-type uncharacterized transport system ATPase subunit